MSAPSCAAESSTGPCPARGMATVRTVSRMLRRASCVTGSAVSSACTSSSSDACHCWARGSASPQTSCRASPSGMRCSGAGVCSQTSSSLRAWSGSGLTPGSPGWPSAWRRTSGRFLPEVLSQRFDSQALLAPQLALADAQLHGDRFTRQLADIVEIQHIVDTPGAGLRRLILGRLERTNGSDQRLLQGSGRVELAAQVQQLDQRAAPQVDGIVEVVRARCAGAPRIGRTLVRL